mmetsp:Transcript_11095/g.26655  ORF Transcript_11095/g.26655 Transcript_11095/m.26655 type:complete len:82 (+) Transcript_11095:1934-2179(+)
MTVQDIEDKIGFLNFSAFNRVNMKRHKESRSNYFERSLVNSVVIMILSPDTSRNLTKIRTLQNSLANIVGCNNKRLRMMNS